jgi:hypothetical protein
MVHQLLDAGQIKFIPWTEKDHERVQGSRQSMKLQNTGLIQAGT